MRIVQVVPQPVHPPQRGGDHRIQGLMSAIIADRGRVKRICQGGIISNHSIYELKNDKKIIDDGYIEIRPAHPFFDIVKFPAILGVPPAAFLSRSKLFWNSKIIEGLFDWAEVIFVEYPWQVKAATRVAKNTPVVYSSHNVEWEKLEGFINPTHPLSSWIRYQMKSLEVDAVELADLVVCTSKKDAKTYLKSTDLRQNSVIVIPNAIEKSKIITQKENSKKQVRKKLELPEDEYIAIFIGSDYLPNVEAAHHCLTIAEKSRASNLPFHILIVGKCGEEIDTSLENVTITGYVEEVEQYMDASDIGINPMYSGSGTNIKMYHYFARGLPVITTPFGARGLPNEEPFIRISELDGFINEIDYFRNLNVEYQQARKEAIKFIKEQGTWEITSSQLLKELYSRFFDG